jgi:hypothetical protein
MPIERPVHSHERSRPTTPQESVSALPEQPASATPKAASTSIMTADTDRGWTLRLGPHTHHILPRLNTPQA